MNPVTGLSLGRIVIGLLAFANPPLAGKLFGLDVANNPQLPYLSRMFGTREIAIGTLTLVSRGSARRNLVLIGIAVDAGDAASGYLGIKEGSVPKVTGGMLIGPAIGAVLSGILGLRTGKKAKAVRSAE